MSDDLLRYQDVSLGYPGKVVLSGVDLSIREGDFLGIVGPNGSGKTTFLRSVLGLLPPLSGRLERRAGRRLRVGYAPQRQVLDPIYPLRVRDIVMMGLYREIGMLRRPKAVHREKVEGAMAATGVLPLADANYRDLSGGQQQRTLIARALVGEPELLVLDEPTNDMDLVGEKSVMDLVARLHAEGGRTVLMVSHLLHVVCRYVEELALIAGGRVVSGTIDEVFTSERLTAIYGIQVRVGVFDGQRVVVAEGSAEANDAG